MVLGTRKYTERVYPISYSTTVFSLTVGYGGQNGISDYFHQATGVVGFIVNNVTFLTALYNSEGTENISWISTGY